MKHYFTIMVSFLCCIANQSHIYAQKNNTDANIIGHVIEVDGEHIPFVTISMDGTTIGTTTDATGHYFLKNIPEGKRILTARFMGYKTEEKEIEIIKGKTIEINFTLKEDQHSLNEIVVSADRNQTLKKATPTLMTILDTKTFANTNSCNLADGLNFQSGLRVENNCQSCGTKQVRMNGLGGAYSQILIDSRPLMSSLASVYGLEQIPANMIERVEVIKGAGSALIGSSSVGGTINIITKEPLRNSAELSHSIMGIGGFNDFDNNTSLNASLISDNQKMGVMLFGQKRHRSAFDQNDDGFSDIPLLNSRTLGFRSFIKTSTYSKFTFEYHNMNEFRRGGDNLHKQPFEAYVAEQIDSNIDAGSIKYDWLSSDGKQRLFAFSSAQLVNRDSYYGGGEPIAKINPNSSDDEIANYNNRLNSFGETKGTTYFAGSQYSYIFDKLLFLPSTLTGGFEYMFDKIEDHSGYRPSSINQKINQLSIYAQNEWANEKWSFLIGLRSDKHSMLDKMIFNPRSNIKFSPNQNISIRFNYGQGFRAPQIFDEDLHVDIAGGDYIITQHAANLKKERSHSFSTSVDWNAFFDNISISVTGEGFYTILNNPFTSITEEQADGSSIKIITNSDGAKVYGINLESTLEFGKIGNIQLGATIQQSRYNKAQKWADDANIEVTKRMMRTPNMYGYFIATANITSKLNTSLSGNYTGGMLVPHENGYIEKSKTEHSSSFFDLNWKTTYTFSLYKGINLELNAGVQNIFNSYQKDLDKGANRASSYVYGPALPRSFFAGIKLSL